MYAYVMGMSRIYQQRGIYISLSHSKYLPSHYTSWLIGFPAMGYDMLSQSPVN